MFWLRSPKLMFILIQVLVIYQAAFVSIFCIIQAPGTLLALSLT